MRPCVKGKKNVSWKRMRNCRECGRANMSGEWLRERLALKWPRETCVPPFPKDFLPQRMVDLFFPVCLSASTFPTLFLPAPLYNQFHRVTLNTQSPMIFFILLTFLLFALTQVRTGWMLACFLLQVLCRRLCVRFSVLLLNFPWLLWSPMQSKWIVFRN